MTAAQAYEADIHYSATYVLARAAGWSAADARTIASANEGVDENQDTVAALEVDSIASSLHQAEQNLKYHCFSQAPGQEGQISADVRKVISSHFADVPRSEGDARSKASRLIALGVALHCQQDAYSHAGFGGSCGSHSGSCYGHTYETFLERVTFRLLKKHYFDPDHPGVSGQRTLGALRDSARELAVYRPRASSLSNKALVALSNELRASGLELPDEVRRDCNRYIAGKWLFDHFPSGGRTQGGSETLEMLPPEVAETCRNVSLASAIVVRIPEPRFPRLNPDASPSLVRADGTYELPVDGHLDDALPAMANYNSHRATVQLSHWRQLISLPDPKSSVSFSACVAGG